MRNKDIEERLSQEIKSTTPDLLDELINELDIKDTTTTIKPRQTHRRSYKPLLASILAVAMLIVFVLIKPPVTKAYAVIDLDVNPGIELSVDKNDKVLNVTGVNDEGKQILDDLKLVGVDAYTASNAILGALVSKGYLTKTANTVLLSVRSTGDTKALEMKLTEKMSAYLSSVKIATAIFTQNIDNDSLQKYANTKGISLGKAVLIHQIMSAPHNRTSEASLLKLSTHQLILLGKEKQVMSEAAYGQADTSEFITKDKAIEIALKKAKVKKAEAKNLMVEFDSEDGRLVYEVEFNHKHKEYEYDIDAITGKIVTSEVESEEEED